MEAAVGSLLLTVAVVAYIAIANWGAKGVVSLDGPEERPAVNTRTAERGRSHSA